MHDLVARFDGVLNLGESQRLRQRSILSRLLSLGCGCALLLWAILWIKYVHDTYSDERVMILISIVNVVHVCSFLAFRVVSPSVGCKVSNGRCAVAEQTPYMLTMDMQHGPSCTH